MVTSWCSFSKWRKLPLPNGPSMWVSSFRRDGDSPREMPSSANEIGSRSASSSRFFFCPSLFLSLSLSSLSLSFSLLLSPSLPPSPSTLFARINSAVQNYRVLRRTVPRKWRPRKGRRFLLVIKIYAGTTWTPGWRRAFSNEEYDEGNYVDGKNA